MGFAIVDILQVGFSNAVSGTASFYLPDTLTPALVYGDDSGTSIGSVVALDSGGRATVFASQQVRMIVQTAGGVTVSDTVINRELDTQVAMSSSGFTGDDVSDIGAAALAAFGGQDFRYVPGLGLNGMKPMAWMSGVHANVMAYAATTAPNVNDGVTLADSAIAAAIAAVSAAGGGVVYFPPGSYLISTPIIVTGKSGVSFRGAGATVSVIKNSGAASDGFTITTCSGFFIEDLSVTHSSSSTGAAISITDSDRARLERVLVSAHSIGVLVAGTSTITSFDDCELLTVNGSAGARGLKFSGSGLYHWVTDTIVGGGNTGSHIEFSGNAGTAHIHRCHFPVLGSTTAINITGGGSVYSVIGCPSLISVATAFVFAGGNKVYQSGNGIDGYATDVASGGTIQPDQQHGNDIRIRGTSTGVAYVISAPAITPTVRAADKLILRFYNNAGGAVTGWTLNAIYHTTGAINTTDGNTTIVTFDWDLDRSIWQEIARAVTS